MLAAVAVFANLGCSNSSGEHPVPGRPGSPAKKYPLSPDDPEARLPVDPGDFVAHEVPATQVPPFSAAPDGPLLSRDLPVPGGVLPASDVPLVAPAPIGTSGQGGAPGSHPPLTSQLQDPAGQPPSPDLSDLSAGHLAGAEGKTVGTVQQPYSIQKDTVDWKSRHATKLFITFPSQGRVCSGTLIGTKTVITNAHCIYDSAFGGWAQSMLVVPGLDGTYMPFGHANAAKLYVADTDWNENNDYGIVILDRHIGHPSMAGYLGYAWMSDSQWNNRWVEYYGYPTAVEGGLRQSYTEGFVPCVYDLRVYHEGDSTPGSSGSGILPWTSTYSGHVVAVNRGVGTWWDCTWSGMGVATRITEHRFNHISSVRDNPSVPYVSGNESSWGWHEGYPTAPVGMVSPAPGKFDMYIRGLDNNVWMQRYSSAGWSPSSVTWTTIGGPAGGVIGRVTAVKRFDEQVDIFARQKTGMPSEEPTPVCTKARYGDSSWWPGPTTWACWADFKTIAWPAATSTDPNRLHVFAVGSDGRVWEKAWTNAAGWLAPIDLGGNTKDPVTVVSRSQFRWDAFIRDATTGQICTKSRNGGAFWPGETQWFCMGTGSAIAGPPTAVTSGVNALDVVGVTQSGQVLRMWWRGGAWQGPMLLGGAFSSGGNVAATVAAVSRSPNQLDFFASDLTNGGIFLKAFDGTTWWPNQSGGWASLGGDGIDVSAVSFASNRLDVVTRSRLDKAVRHRYWQNIWW
ncbi:MAG: trypsin-like serine protease [Polyangiaceae bacterium]|nr:trypsin-like serine protease [Polyangiaceae bacterium]